MQEETLKHKIENKLAILEGSLRYIELLTKDKKEITKWIDHMDEAILDLRKIAEDSQIEDR